MDALILLLFIGAVMVAGAVWFFLWTANQHTFDHGDRLSLLPLADDEANRDR